MLRKFSVRLLSSFAFLFLIYHMPCLAQDTTATKEKTPASLKVLAFGEINTDHLMDGPDSIKSDIANSRGGSFYIRYDIPFGLSKFGISPALGINSYNLSTNGTLSWTIDDTTRFTKASGFKRNKMVVNYAEVPVELFYMTKTKTPLRIAAGFKGGYLVSSHTKYKKDSSTKTKEYYIKNLTELRYGPTLRVTYGWFGLNAFYSLTPLFEKNVGPTGTPYSIGITIAPY